MTRTAMHYWIMQTINILSMITRNSPIWDEWKRSASWGCKCISSSPSDLSSWQTAFTTSALVAGTGRVKGSDLEDGTGSSTTAAYVLHTQPPTTLSQDTSVCRQNQKPVHHCRPAEDVSQPTSGQLSSPYQTISLRCVLTAQVTRQRSIFFIVCPSCRRAPLPTTSTKLTLNACGPFWSRLTPHWVLERERKSKYLVQLQ